MRPHSLIPRLLGFSRRCQHRFTSTSTDNDQNQKDSIFSSSQSPWDHLFDNIDDSVRLVPRTRGPHPLTRKSPTPTSTTTQIDTGTSTSTRRQAMTAREISMFDEMFNLIFNAVADQKNAQQQTDPLSNFRVDSSLTANTNTTTTGGVSDLLGKLRHRSRHLKWTSALDEQLDRKKESIDLCETDYELLHWSLRDVFGTPIPTADKEDSSETTTTDRPTLLPPQIYPYLLAHLMRTFRDKYHDPHLALAIFNHARRISIHSYVFGCSTPAYNELIRTYWSHFRNLKAVHEAIHEMLVNGVELDAQTRKIVEAIRRRVGRWNLWNTDADLERRPLGDDDDDSDNDDVLTLLAKIEALVASSSIHTRHRPPRKSSSSPSWNAWKATVTHDRAKDVDDWTFDDWGLKRGRDR